MTIAQDASLAEVTRRHAYAEMTAPALIARSFEVYLYSEGANFSNPAVDTGDPTTSTNGSYYTFDDSSDPVKQQKWSLATSTSPSKTATPRVRIGDSTLAQPDWPPCPPVVPLDANYNANVADSGYTVTDEVSIVKWNVPGGLRYVDTQA